MDSTIVRVKITGDRKDITAKAINNIAQSLNDIVGREITIAHTDREQLEGYGFKYDDPNRVNCEFRFFCDLQECEAPIKKLVFKLKLKYDMAEYTDILRL